MHIVIETSAGVDPSTNASLREIFSKYQLSATTSPLYFVEHIYSYYDYNGSEDVETIINELLQVPGVNAAYIKPKGVPPSM